jgi:hypothetical protein
MLCAGQEDASNPRQCQLEQPSAHSCAVTDQLVVGKPADVGALVVPWVYERVSLHSRLIMYGAM